MHDTAKWTVLGPRCEGAIEDRIGRRLFPVHRGVYAVGRPELTQRGRWMAAVLACGEGAALSHESAAANYGLLEAEGARPHVSVPLGRHPHHPAVAAHRGARMPPVILHERIPTVDPLFTLLDLAVSRSLSALDRLVNEADKLRVVSADDALERVAQLKGRRGVRKLHQVLSAHKVTDSDLERRFLRLVAEAGLPSPETQVAICGFRVDFYWRDLDLIVETDGLTYHRTASQQARDRERDQILTAAGYTPLRFTNGQVRRAPRHVIQTLSTVAARLRRGPGHLAA